MNKVAVNIYSVMDALDLQSDFLSFFVLLSTGEILLLTEEEKKKRPPSPALYAEISLPIDTLDLLHSFCELLEEDFRDHLLPYVEEEHLDLLFSFFQQYQLEDAWLLYKEDKLREFAIQWCEEHEIPYVEEPIEEEDW
ncbi:MAG: hypothetical protein FJZ58_07195 [Chlamydiae bacterium]|nr:hypothetical protein [Chlamydiota bacterium]